MTLRQTARSSGGFTLLEVLVAATVLVVLVAGFGSVVQTSIRQRIHADDLAAAAILANTHMERLLSLSAASEAPELAPGDHGPLLVDTTAAETITGPFEIRWSVSENALPLVFPRTRRIQVTASHAVDSGARCEIETIVPVP